MSNTLVSVIVPVYNVEKYLHESLSTLTSQTHSNLEIILVDDCSTDGSGAVCDKWADSDSRIKVIHKAQNEGVSSARNTALRQITGDYVYFMDPDDIISPYIIESLLNNIIRYEADVSACHEIAFTDSDEKPDFNSVPELETIIEDSDQYISHFMDTFTGLIGWLWNKLYKRSVVNDLVFRDFRVLEDIVFNAEASVNINKCVWIEDRLYGYRIREDSATAARKKDFTYEAATAWLFSYEIFKDHFPSFSEKYLVYLLSKFANLRAQARTLYGKESETKMEKFFNDIYDRNIHNISVMSIKDRLKLFLARHSFDIYYISAKNKL